MDKNNSNAIILDFWSETNRGDAAMQETILQLSKKYFPNTKFTVSAAYGTNQIDYVRNQLDYSLKHDVEIIGGIKHTFYPFKRTALTRNRPVRLILDVLGSLYALFIIFLIWIKIPLTVVKLIVTPQMAHSLEKYVEADFVIWNGRNFRGDTSLKEPYSILLLLIHPILFIALGTPMVCLGASVWDIKNHLSQKLLKWVFSKTKLVSAREAFTYEQLKLILGENASNIQLLPDLSFYVLEQITREIPARQEKQEGDRELTFGLTVVDWYADGIEARNKYARALKRLVEYLNTNFDLKIVIIPQVTYAMEKTDKLLDEILDREHENITIISEQLSIKDLVTKYSTFDFLVATRMHSGIFCWSAGTPVCAIAYDHGAKWDIFKMMGVRDTVIDFDKIESENTLINHFNSIWEKRKELKTVSQEKIATCFKDVEKHFQLSKEIFLDLGAITDIADKE